MVVESATAGTGRHVIDLVDGLAVLGHRVLVVYARNRADRSFVEAVSRWPASRAVALPMRRSLGPWDLLSVKRLIAIARRLGPFEVIHGQGTKAGAFVRLLPAAIPGVRIYTPHALVTMDPELGWMKRNLFSGVERALFRRMHGLIAVSQDEASHARKLGVSSKRMTVIHNGVPSEEVSDVHLASWSVQPFTFGFMGRLVPQKNPLAAIEAFANLVGGNGSFRLRIAGEGPLSRAMRARVDALGLSSRVDFEGNQAPSPWLSQIQALLMPSRYEGLPYSVLEAFRAGVPVAGFDVGGMRELIQHQSNGLLVPALDVKGLCEAMQSLSADCSRWQKLSQQAQRTAAGMTLDKMVQETLGFYCRV